MINRIKELVEILNKAVHAYYQESKEIMSNLEYDKLYDELLELERQTGTVLTDSPTQRVEYDVVSNLPKMQHKTKMLSLDKTKEVDKLVEWIGEKDGLLSFKLDGLTIILTYENGELVQAVTRGNGEIGEVVTNNAKVFKNLPRHIAYKDKLVIRGEAVIRYSDFEKINEVLQIEEQYKNPRNLCSGSVRQLNNEITAKRNINLYVFAIIEADGVDFEDKKSNQFEWLRNQGFQVVEYYKVNKFNLESIINKFKDSIDKRDIPSDGLVLTFDSISYSNSLGETAKFPRHSMAFKWTDEIKESKIEDIIWNTSRTGLINPVAVFEPVEIEGTTVKQASLHNVSIIESLELGIGDTVEVYKANMIIPQIADNLTRSNTYILPSHCNACGAEVEIRKVYDTKALYCTNPNCSAKILRVLGHYVSRNATNIEGLSEATIEKLIDKEIIKDIADIYRINEYKDIITNMEGLGEKSYENLIKAIDKSKNIKLANFINALGISNVGFSTSKSLCKHYKNDINEIMNATKEELITIEGFGAKIAESIVNYFENSKNRDRINEIMSYLILEKEEVSDEQKLKGLIFVITGEVTKFKNRDELKDFIEKNGGKVTSSVTSNTSYLINNDVNSSSSKNKTAKKLGVRIIDEEKFMQISEKNVEKC